MKKELTTDQKLLPAALDANFTSNDFVAMVADILEQGNLDLGDVAKLAKMKKGLDSLWKNPRFKKFMEEERSRYGNENPRLFGMEVQRKVVSTNWDFSECNDLELNAWYKILEMAMDNVKIREEQLKLMKAGTKKTEQLFSKLPSIAWDDCGEVVDVTAPVKLTKDGLAFNELK